jgi:hypothetical protein
VLTPVRIRLEGHLERLEAWLEEMETGLKVARQRSDYSRLVDALGCRPEESLVAVRLMAVAAPELQPVLRKLEHVRGRTEAFIAERASKLLLPTEPLEGARALAAEPVTLTMRLFCAEKIGERAAGNLFLSAFGPFFLLVHWNFIIPAAVAAGVVAAVAAIPIVVHACVSASIRVVVTPHRLLLGSSAVDRTGLTPSMLASRLEGFGPRDHVALLVATLWPNATASAEGP